MAAALSCTECEELLALAAVGALSPDEAAAMQKHVSSCQSCQATSWAFQQTAAVLPDSLDLLAPPAQLRRRLIERVHPVARLFRYNAVVIVPVAADLLLRMDRLWKNHATSRRAQRMAWAS